MVEETAPTVYSAVRGARHRGQAALQFYMDLAIGDGVMLQREPDNLHDPNAVMVLEPDYEVHIGYLARDRAAIVSMWMAKGWVYVARVVKRAKRKKIGADIWVVDHTLCVKCTPLPPMKAKAKTKVAAPIRDLVPADE
jgi:hypothetical protein